MSAATNTTVLDAPRSKTSGNLLRRARVLHLYLGTLFSPAILFFALTGAAQVFSWHETTPGRDYQPPMWIQKMAELHKKQDLNVHEKRPPNAAGARPEGTRAQQPPQAPKKRPETGVSTLLLKWFSVVMALGLAFTTLLGIYMSFKYNRDRRVIWGLLALGTLLPAALIFA